MALQTKHFYAFGPFRLDSEKRVLVRDGTPVLLSPKIAEVLLVLVESAGHLVQKDELIQRVWPDAFVEEGSLNKSISLLRKILGQWDGGREYVETIPKRGYRFVAPVSEVTHAEGNPQPRTLAGANLLGKKVSHYRVLEIIGGGGMGLVYKAEDLKLGRRVALKFLPEEVGDDPNARERFEREARAVSALSHPNICPIYEFAEHDGQPFIVMELLQGRTLRDHIADGHSRLTQPEGLEVAIQIASGLEAAHEKGIIHRDIKPANIFITEKKVAKILDFGVAKMVEVPDFSPADGDVSAQSFQDDSIGAPEGAPLQNQTILTRTGMKPGTAGYMSPEQVRGEALDARTDIFSFGLVLYEMATGERAFTGETEAILHDAIQHREPKPVRALAPEITPRLEEVIGHCLEKEPSERYQSVAELTDALARERVQFPLVTPEGGQEPKKASHPRRWFAFALLAGVVVIALAGVFYRLAHPRFKLTDKDTVVLADFENQTGDPVFDGSLTWTLRIALEQTPFLNVLSSDKVGRVLTRAGHDAPGHLTPDLATEVCIKTNSTAVLVGTIADAGNRYQIALRAVRCDTGKVVARSEAAANERNRIVAELGRAAVDLRGKLGEPSTTIQQFNKPLDHATSASVETLKLYTEALERGNQKGPTTAVADMLQVTERDPSFAIAYRTLGTVFFNLGEWSAAEGSLKKAFELREQLTDRERLRIEGSYYQHVTGEIGRAIDVWQEMIQEYPSDRIAPGSLSWCLRAIGELEQAAIAAREAIRVDPEQSSPYGNLMLAQIWMHRWAEAKAAYEEALSRKVDIDVLHELRFHIAFLETDRDGMQRELEWEKSHPSANGDILFDEAINQLYFGYVRVARTSLAQAVSKRIHAGLPESATLFRCSFARTEAEIGETVRAREDATDALAAYPSSRDLKICTSFVLARVGNGADAQRMATEIRSEKPLGTITNGLIVPALTGAALLAEEKPAEALKALEPSVPYFRSGAYCDDAYMTVYLRGMTLLKLRRKRDAVVEFQKIIEHPGFFETSVIGPLAHLQLARAQVMMGDKEAARKSYQDFLTLWKDADPDIPIYKQARAEYARLR